MSEQFPNDNVVKYGIIENKTCLDDNSVWKLVSVEPHKRNSKLFQAVLQVDLDTYYKTIEAGKLNVGFDLDCPVYCAIEPRKCFNYFEVHHIANQCKNEPISPKCSSDHKMSDCRSSHLIGVHCNNMKNNLKINIPADPVWDRNCYVYKKPCRNFSKRFI